MNTQCNVRRATKKDIPAIAAINSRVFLGDRDRVESAEEWAGCWLRAFPLYQYFVIETDGLLAGFSGWQAHGGFHRAEPVFELDQLGVDPGSQGRGLASELTHAAIRALMVWAKQTNDRIESHVTFVVWAHALNFNAIGVYAKDFTDGPSGFRVQFGARPEMMLRVRVPVVRPMRS